MRHLAVVCVACLSLIAPVQGLAASAAENLASAVRFPTVSHQNESDMDVEAFAGLHAFLRATYPLTFSQLQVEVINGYSLLMIWPGSDPEQAPVLYTAHIDVVPVEPGTEAGWTHPAFAGVIADGRIYGRGTLDDKIGVISLLEATERLLAQGYRPARTLVLGFGHDEEIGGEEGAARIAERLQELGMHFEWMVDEGSYIIDENPLLPGKSSAAIGVAEKAYLTLVLTVQGQGGHSSMPPAQTTIGQLAAAVVKVENSPFPPRLVAPVAAMLERSAPYQEFPSNLVFENLWLTESLVTDRMLQDKSSASMVRTTTAATMFNAGVKENVIPQSAEARINFRLLPGDTPDMVIAHVRKVIDDPGVEVSLSREWRDPPPIAAMSGGGFDAIATAAKSVYPDVVVLPFMMMATTDIRHYIELADNHYRFHGAVMTLEQSPGIHGTDEWVGVESFERAVDVAVQMLRESGGKGTEVVRQQACSEPRAEVCTMEYAPVCANKVDGSQQQYSNGCSACADPDVNAYNVGPC